MARTPHLNLPVLASAQAQKHVTVNEALDAVDAVAQCAVKGRDRNDPPSGAADGDRWLIGAAPIGVWTSPSGQARLVDQRRLGIRRARPRLARLRPVR